MQKNEKCTPGDSSNSFENCFSIPHLLEIFDSIPACICVMNERAESVYCNNSTLALYGLDSKAEFNENFYNLTPEFQPDGKISELSYTEYVLTALEKGEVHFSWLDHKKTGEELPLNISIYKMNAKDKNGDSMLVSTLRDLRPFLAGDEEDALFDEYYYNRITYKDLFTTVAELSEEWFWVYDVSMATIQFFGKGREILGLSAEKQPFPSYVVDSGMVHPDDLDTFLKFDEHLRTGVVKPTEVRFIQPSGACRYYRIIYKTMYNKDGKPVFTIGKTYDIDKQKKLEVLSRTDLLTNCLNKITTEDVVKSIIDTSPDSSHALYIIDVDDFKSVNDELGHYFGDNTLIDIAKNLHHNFRGGDIIGRIGGDEFLVFLKNISDETVIKSKAKAIANAFKNSYSGENRDYKISGSIGIALYPKHAQSYEGLYKCADKALYRSKTEGKDRYTIYSEELSDGTSKKLTAVDNSTRQPNSYFDADLTTAVFDLMYQSENVTKSMNTVVRLIGTKFSADRCYVAQTFDEGKSYSITYEWATSAKHGIKHFFQNIDKEKIFEFFKELEERSIMFNTGIDDLRHKAKEAFNGVDIANSYMLVQTKGKGFSRLIIGIDDSNKHRVWSEKEINTMQYIIKLVSIFIDCAHIK